MKEFLVPVSLGEVADKITILKIKKEKITDENKLFNVLSELQALELAFKEYVGPISSDVNMLIEQLLDVNRTLWKIEDDIRDCEKAADFSDTFIQLARSVYITNDIRARLKKDINLALGSRLIEEKSYSG
ncbi:DUF6165 family protein [Brevundimonas naejangsanensis]